MKKNLKYLSLGALIFIVVIFGYLFVGKAPKAEKIQWGVNFSQKHAEALGMDWKKTYSALLDDMGVKNIKLTTYWDLIEKEKDNYDFGDLDWQLGEAGKRQAKILLIVGMKTGRWPECNIPPWARNLKKDDQQKEILELLGKIVEKYEGSASIAAWQVENEPLFPFGECPWRDKNFLKKEIELVKSLDGIRRPVVVSDSGEFSLWFSAAGAGDIVGITMYEKTWFKELKAYVKYPLPPVFYWRKANIIKKLFDKDVIVIELQAEPWCPNLLYNCGLEEQEKTMNLEQFKKNVEFAGKTGLKEFYLWGAEWWHWLKEKQQRPEIWEEAEKLFL